MKKILFLLACVLVCASAFSQETAMARVYKINGIRVFTDCEPISEYDVISDEKVGMTWSGQYTEVRDKLIKKTRKNTPEADGIIFDGDSKIIVIKFKETENKEDLDLARVNTVGGMLSFTDCDPVSKYTVMGRVKGSTSLLSTPTFHYVQNKLLKKAIKEYPSGEAILLTFTTGGSDIGTVIKFDK